MPNEWYRAIPAQTADRSVTNVATFDAAYTASSGGAHDRITMRGGTYNMSRLIAKSGLQIVAYPGEHVIVVGGFNVTTDDVWIVGLEITDPAHTTPYQGLIANSGKNNSFINNWCHHSASDVVQSINDFGADTGGGTLVYGNVCHDTRHVMYMQNKDSNPTKYYAHNYLSKPFPDPQGQGTFLAHQYSSSDPHKCVNIHWLENIFVEGGSIVGSSNTGTVWNSRWERNLFFRHNFRMYNQAYELTFKDNRCYEFANGSSVILELQRWHGVGEAFDGPPYYHNDSTMTGNFFFNNTTFKTVSVITWFVNSLGNGQFAIGALRSTDNVDNNTFYGNFKMEVKANNSGFLTSTNIGQWRTDTNSVGKQFDTNSTFTSGNPPDYYTIWQNDYDANRATIFVQGYGASVSVNLPRTGDIYNIEDQWGTPVYSGASSYTVATAGTPFIGIVKYTAGGGGGTYPNTLDSTATNSIASGTSHLVTMPAVVNAGDLLLAKVVLSGVSTTFTPPAGWTEIFDQNNTVDCTATICVKKAVGNEDGTTVDFVSAVAGSGCALVTRYAAGTWFDDGNLLHAIETAFSLVANTTVDPPSLNPTNWDVEATNWLSVVMTRNLFGTLTSMSAGYTDQQSATAGNSCIVKVEKDVTAASEDPGATTWTNNNTSFGITIAVRPAAGGAPPDPGGTVFSNLSISSHKRHGR